MCVCAFVCEMSSDGIPDSNFFDKLPPSSLRNRMSVFRHYAFRRQEHEQCEDQHNDQGMCVCVMSSNTLSSCSLVAFCIEVCPSDVCVCVCVCVRVRVTHQSRKNTES